MDFPGCSDSKETAWNAGDLGSIPGSGRSPGERNGSPLQYSGLGNSVDRGTWWATVHRFGCKESDTTEWLTHPSLRIICMFWFQYCHWTWCYHAVTFSAQRRAASNGDLSYAMSPASSAFSRPPERSHPHPRSFSPLVASCSCSPQCSMGGSRRAWHIPASLVQSAQIWSQLPALGIFGKNNLSFLSPTPSPLAYSAFFLLSLGLVLLNPFAPPLLLGFKLFSLPGLSDGASSFQILKALVVKNLPANAGNIRDTGSIPGSGRSPRGGHGNPLQYSCPENSMDSGAWQTIVHGVAKSQTWLKRLITQR